MTMRVTIITTCMGESGTLLNAGSTYTVSDTFGAELVGLRRATDTDGVLQPASVANNVIASRTLTKEDVDNVVNANSGSAIVLTIPQDVVLGTIRSECLAIYQAGAGAVSFAAGGGVTLRGTAPAIAQYGTLGIMRVGANEWAYL
jgi:hypothetical protein